MGQGQSSLSFNTAMMHFKKGKFDYAIPLLEDSITSNFKVEEAYYYKALCYVHLKQYTKAVQDLNSSLALNPFQDNAYFYKGMALFTIGEYAKAIPCFKKALNQKDKTKDASYFLGVCYFQMQLLQEALAVFNKLLQEDPSHVDALYQKGNILLATDLHVQAITSYEAAIDFLLDKENDNLLLSNCYVMKGRALFKLTKVQESLQTFKKAVMYNSANEVAYYNMAIIYMHLEANILALGDLERVLTLKKDFNLARSMKVKLHLDLPTFDSELVEILNIYNDMSAIEPDNADCHNSRAIIHYITGDSKRAMELFNKALSLKPSNPFVLVNQAT
ncbi:MAG: tetratricopeptide repeat protein, partial [Janthinobacterium lividum]